ncbi:MAG: KTSC domain-containing protein [Candidatus Paceibacterota bacterium]|jgi:hypothetical protein
MINNNKSDDDLVWEKLLSDTPERKPIHRTFPDARSSIIKEAKYDHGKQILVITFKGKKEETYTYFQIPEDVGVGFFDVAEDDLKSLGKYFTSKIKNQYTFIKAAQKKTIE